MGRGLPDLTGPMKRRQRCAETLPGSSADSSLLVPDRLPPSTSARRTLLRTVSGVPTPSGVLTAVIGAHSES